MKLKRTILALFMILLIILSHSSFAINSSNNKEIETSSEFNELWAVLVTFGSPLSDDKNARDLLNILKLNGWNENNILYLRQ